MPLMYNRISSAPNVAAGSTRPVPLDVPGAPTSGGSRLLPILLLAGVGVGIWWFIKHRKKQGATP